MSSSEVVIQTIHQQLTELAKKYQLRRQDQLACPGLSVSEAYILGELSRLGPCMMTTLAENLNVSKAAVNKAVKSLQERQYVRREQEKDDRRVTWISLSAKGEKHYKKLQEQFSQHLAEELDDLGARALEELGKGLEHLNGAVDSWRRKLGE